MIDSEHLEDCFVPFYGQEEDKEELSEDMAPEASDVSGNVLKVEQVFEEERVVARKEAERILEEARAQAKLFIESASNDANSIRENARSEGYNEGYAAGEIESRQRYDELQQELEQKIETHQAEYSQALSDIEPRYVDVLISLIQKLTGVLLEDHSDVILYLIKNSIGNLDKATHYVIRSSTEDSAIMDVNRNEIRGYIGEEASVEFVEEKSLKHNECIIETDTQMVDCGFETQLNSLVETLKMLVI